MSKESYFEVLSRASSFLAKQKKEVKALQFLLLERLGWSMTDWLIHLKEPIPKAVKEQLEADLQLLLADHPPQYILGYCDFYGNRLTVTKDTLIPRPETEELVELCLKNNDLKARKAADIGTGSGAIAVALKKNRPYWQILATDISQGALLVAQDNALKLGTEIDFRLGDLTEPLEHETFDLILSNPPYISLNEWEEMDASVQKFEPKRALFAGHNGLAFYQKLAVELPQYLRTSGQIYLEIGHHQGRLVQELFQANFPEKKVEILKDINGNERMIFLHD